jgi:branched-chain amino acid aminotransferase
MANHAAAELAAEVERLQTENAELRKQAAASRRLRSVASAIGASAATETEVQVNAEGLEMSTKGREVYWCGEFIPEGEARISIFDCALMYGDMVFEMTRTFAGVPYRLRDHLERLYGSLRYAEIDCGMTIDEMEAATMATIERNKEKLDGLDFQIMHDVTRGGLSIYENMNKDGNRPLVSINVLPLVKHNASQADKYLQGVHTVITPQQSVPARYIDPKAKNRSRLFYKKAELHAARLDEGAYALLTDERGFITEGTGNNYFIVKNGEVYTPRGHDVLRGVSRKACIAICGRLGIPVHEADFSEYDVGEADEAWHTSTTICMVPSTRFNFAPIGDGTVGPVYSRILAAWSEEVGVDIAGQAVEFKEMLDGGFTL